jgi:hypothetical protein
MARTAVTVTTLAKDASTLQATGNAVDPANGHVIAGPLVASHLVLDIDSTFAGAKTFTVKAGVHAGGALGDLVVSLNAQRALLMLTLFRFAQADGSINIDVATGATGTIRAYRDLY